MKNDEKNTPKFVPVKPSYVACLKLNALWLPINTMTAQAAFQALFQNKAYALDKNSLTHTRESWFDLEKTSYFEETPVLRSASQAWPIPTLIVLRSKAYLKPSLKKIYSKRDLCEHFDYRCANCNKRFSIGQLTFEHIVPQKLVGNWRDNNLTLTCIGCNSRKADLFPFEENNLKPVSFPPHYVPVRPAYLRKEWEPFLFKS